MTGSAGRHGSSVAVEVVTRADDEIVRAFGRLLPQLSPTAPALDAPALDRVLAQESNTVLVARLEGEIVGTLTLVIFPIPTGLRAWIEDVVVHESARGSGVGSALTQKAIALARSAGARSVDLTSRPAREEANRLYLRLGFVPRDSRLFRLTTDSGSILASMQEQAAEAAVGEPEPDQAEDE